MLNKNMEGPYRMLALGALGCALFFTATHIFSHLIPNQLQPLSDTLSRYALEEHGYILELGFYAIGITQLIIAWFFLFGVFTRQSTSSAVLLSLAGVGVIVVAIYPTLPPPSSAMERFPHMVGAVMHFLFFPLAAIMISATIQNRFFKLYTWLTGYITAILFVAMLVLFYLPALQDFRYFGLIEKIDIVIINSWLIAMALTLFIRSKSRVLKY